MDSSLQSSNLATDERDASLATEEVAGAEHHIHLPNPSLWPVLLSVAILVAVVGLLFLPDNPWLTIIAIPFILLGIMGWALEDPMAPLQAKFVTYRDTLSHSRFQLGQDVVDKEGHWVGLVQARFNHYILVERGTLAVKAFYVPHSVTRDPIKNNVVRLTVSESELLAMEANRVPDDLYDEAPEPDLPRVSGVPQFARGPLSPAQTGHYNYGPNYPGINTDASGSYERDYVIPNPHRYVGERRKIYKDTQKSAVSAR